MEVLPWYVWIILIGLFSSQVYTLTRCCSGSCGAASTTTSENAKLSLQTDAITNITIVSVIATLVLAIAAYIYLADNTTYARPYTMLMVHAGFLISSISATIAITKQLNSF
jgi:hypothetical protein